MDQTLQDETKQPPPPPSTQATPTTTTTSNNYLSTHLIVPYFITPNGTIKRPEHLIAWWSRIFSFYVPDDKDRIKLRSLCRLFRDALKPPPRWTTFPHSNYPTLNGLINKLNEMYATLPAIVWEVSTVQGTWSVGMKCQAYCQAKYPWSGTIQKVNEDGTFDVVFDDHRVGTRKNLPSNEIQSPNVSRSCQGSCFIIGYLFPCVVRSHFFFSFLLIYIFFLFFLFSSVSSLIHNI
jgi:hypothetical protein